MLLVATYLVVMFGLYGLFFLLELASVFDRDSTTQLRNLTALVIFVALGPLLLRCLDRILFLGRSDVGNSYMKLLRRLSGDQ